jgi:8-oxo-dGTP diphosphatase
MKSDLEALVELGGKYQVADLNAPAVSSTAYRKHGNERCVNSSCSRLYSPREIIRMNSHNNKLVLEDFKVGVDNVIFSIDSQKNRLLVLLVKRQDEPYFNKWCLPGTLVRQGESLEAAAYRILAEKIQAKNLYLEQLYTFGGPNRDPRELPDSYGVRYLSVSYFALVRFEEAELIVNHHYTTWYMMDRVPKLAFDHNLILNYGYQRLRSKLEYSPIAFDVLPELFTLNDLYQLYTSVFGKILPTILILETAYLSWVF